MKKLLLSALAILMVATVSAQGRYEKSFVWGPKLGMNVTSITKNDLNAKAGFTAGVFGEYRFTDRWALSADLLYSMQGGRSKESGIVTVMNSHYLNIPILANFRIIEGLSVKAGLQPGFNLGTNTKVKANGNKYTSKGGGLNTVDFAIPIGVAYDFPFGLRIDARYNIGVSRVAKKQGNLIVRGSNSVFALTVGWRF